jgi:hypothetical protein
MKQRLYARLAHNKVLIEKILDRIVRKVFLLMLCDPCCRQEESHSLMPIKALLDLVVQKTVQRLSTS